VVSALGGLGARIVALQKSEPSLEDVFVELVGRGFDEEDESTDDRSPTPPSEPSMEQDEITHAGREGEPVEVEAMR
jgi:hypothetical protein